MSRKLLILLSITGAGAGFWWWMRQRREPDGGKGLLPVGALPGSLEMPAVSVSPSGEVTVEETITVPAQVGGLANVAIEGQRPVVTSVGPTEQEHRTACAWSAYYCFNGALPEACADMQRCKQEGWL